MGYPQERQQPGMAVGRAEDVKRRSAVYGILTHDVDANGMAVRNMVVVGYIGQTVQTVKQREDQHRDSQPFSDLIVGGSFTIEEGFWTAAELDAREQHYIRVGVSPNPGVAPQRPRYNYHHNEGNPIRIPIPEAVRHRQRREPGWVPPVKGEQRAPRQQTRIPQQRTRVTVASGVEARLARWWGRNRWLVIGLGSVWATLFVGLLWAAWDALDGWDLLGAAAGGATLPFAAVQGEIWRRRVCAWWRRTTRPRRTRRRR